MTVLQEEDLIFWIITVAFHVFISPPKSHAAMLDFCLFSVSSIRYELSVFTLLSE